MRRAVLGESQFAALISRQPIVVQTGGENLELVLADIGRDRLLEIHLLAMDKPRDPVQAKEFLPARRPARRRKALSA
jgi:hypothetical protein